MDRVGVRVNVCGGGGFLIPWGDMYKPSTNGKYMEELPMNS